MRLITMRWTMSSNQCVCCGEIIPEGRQVCPTCESKRVTRPTLDDLRPLSRTEREMIARLETEDEAIAAILNRRTFLQGNREYIGSLCREQARGKYHCRNEKETVTLPILYEEDV